MCNTIELENEAVVHYTHERFLEMGSFCMRQSGSSSLVKANFLFLFASQAASFYSCFFLRLSSNVMILTLSLPRSTLYSGDFKSRYFAQTNFESAVVEANSHQMLFPSHLSCSEDEAYSLCPVDAHSAQLGYVTGPGSVVPRGLQGLHSLGRLRHSMGSGSLRLLQLRKPAGRTEEVEFLLARKRSLGDYVTTATFIN